MKGSCFCGKISFKVKDDVSGLYQCHCSECRKTTGAAANAGFIISEENVQWLSGKDQIKTFVKDSGYKVNFCNNCGSPVPNQTSVEEGKVWVPAGLLDDDSGFTVKNHIYVASKASWDEIGGEAHQFQSLPDDISILMS